MVLSSILLGGDEILEINDSTTGLAESASKEVDPTSKVDLHRMKQLYKKQI